MKDGAHQIPKSVRITQILIFTQCTIKGCAWMERTLESNVVVIDSPFVVQRGAPFGISMSTFSYTSLSNDVLQLG